MGALSRQTKDWIKFTRLWCHLLVSAGLVAVGWQVLKDTYPKETEKEKTLYQSLKNKRAQEWRMEMVEVSQSICVTVSVVST